MLQQLSPPSMEKRTYVAGSYDDSADLVLVKPASKKSHQTYPSLLHRVCGHALPWLHIGWFAIELGTSLGVWPKWSKICSRILGISNWGGSIHEQHAAFWKLFPEYGKGAVAKVCWSWDDITAWWDQGEACNWSERCPIIHFDKKVDMYPTFQPKQTSQSLKWFDVHMYTVYRIDTPTMHLNFPGWDIFQSEPESRRLG